MAETIETIPAPVEQTATEPASKKRKTHACDFGGCNYTTAHTTNLAAHKRTGTRTVFLLVDRVRWSPT